MLLTTYLTMSVMAKKPVTPAAVRVTSLGFRSSLVVLMFALVVVVVVAAVVVSMSVQVATGMLTCWIEFYL